MLKNASIKVPPDRKCSFLKVRHEQIENLPNQKSVFAKKNRSNKVPSGEKFESIVAGREKIRAISLIEKVFSE